MWVKMMGSILIIFSTAGFGYFKGLEYKNQVEELQRLKQIIWQLRGEMKYIRVSLGELCERISQKAEPPYKQWLIGISREIEGQKFKNLGVLWKKETENLIKNVRFPKEIEKELLELGYQLGNIDLEMQEQMLAWYEKKLEEKRRQLSEQVTEKMKLCNCLGIMSGLLFVILIW